MPYLVETVHSILSQTHTHLEFIIWDDGSTDATAKYLRTLTDPRVHVILGMPNKGQTVCLNACLNLVKGDFVARQDSDDYSEPQRLVKQLHPFVESTVGVTFCWARSIDIEGKSIAHYVDLHCRCSNADLLYIYPGKVCAPDATSMYSKAAIEKVGRFAEIFGTGQTYNYNRRIQQFFDLKIVQKILYVRRVRELPARRDTAMRILNTHAKLHPIIK